MLDGADDLTIELPDNISDVPPSGIEPGQVDQNGGDRHGQQHEAGKCRPQSELALGAQLRRLLDRRNSRHVGWDQGLLVLGHSIGTRSARGVSRDHPRTCCSGERQ